MRVAITIAVFGGMILLAACEQGPTVMGWGMAVASVNDEPGATPASTDDDAAFAGAFHATARVAISNGDGWLELGGWSPVEFPLRSAGSGVDVGRSFAVPTGAYSRVRLTMSGAEARIRAGTDSGGDTRVGKMIIPVGNGDELVIERRVNEFRLTGGTRVRLTFDLNSDQWLDQASVLAGDIDPLRVTNAITVHRQIEPR
jgi:hypothetical protein